MKERLRKGIFFMLLVHSITCKGTAKLLTILLNNRQAPKVLSVLDFSMATGLLVMFILLIV